MAALNFHQGCSSSHLHGGGAKCSLEQSEANACRAQYQCSSLSDDLITLSLRPLRDSDADMAHSATAASDSHSEPETAPHPTDTATEITVVGRACVATHGPDTRLTETGRCLPWAARSPRGLAPLTATRMTKPVWLREALFQEERGRLRIGCTILE
jgi:hypothetical protein